MKSHERTNGVDRNLRFGVVRELLELVILNLGQSWAAQGIGDACQHARQEIGCLMDGELQRVAEEVVAIGKGRRIEHTAGEIRGV